MITADTASIRPEMKLAELALSKDGLITQTAPEDHNNGSGLGTLNGMALAGPMPMPMPLCRCSARRASREQVQPNALCGAGERDDGSTRTVYPRS